MPIEAKLSARNLVLVLKNLRRVEERTMAAAERGMRRGLDQTVTIIQREFLSGPRPKMLGVRTTRLRQSISYKVDRIPDGRVARLGTNVKYGAFHEFGFKGTVNVRQHTRVLHQFTAGAKEVFDARKKVVDRKGRFIGYKESRKKASGRQKSGFVAVQFVRGHTRRMNYAGRPFVRPGLRKGMPIILREIKGEIAKLGVSEGT